MASQYFPQSVIDWLRNMFDARYGAGITLANSNGSDDTTAIQAVLTANAGRTIFGQQGSSYIISAPLVISSGTTLDMTGCTVTLKANSNCNMIQNKARNTSVRTVTDAVTTAGSATMTSATAAFTSADIGRAVTLSTAGLGSSPWAATITAVGGATSVTLNTNAVLSNSGQTLTLYNRDTDIAITGGLWDRGANTGPTSDALHTMFFRRVDRLNITNLRITSTAGKYSIAGGDVTFVNINNIDLNVFSDGVHFDGPASNLIVRNIHGTTGDDFVAFTPQNSPVSYADVSGNISNFTIEDLQCTSAVQACAIYAQASYSVTNGHVSRVFGITTQHGVILKNATGGFWDEIFVEGVHVVCASGFHPVYLLTNSAGGGGAGHVTIRDILWDSTNTANGSILVDAGATVAKLVVENLHHRSNATGAHAVRIDGTVTDLTIRGHYGTMIAGAYTLGMTSATGVVTRATISEVHTTSGGGIANVINGSTIAQLCITNCNMTGTSWIADLATSTEVMLSGSWFGTTSGTFNLRTSSAVKVRSGGCGFNNAATGTNSGTIRGLSTEFQIDVSAASVVKNLGDQFYNTNGALGCGVGPVVCFATGVAPNWRSLRDAALTF